MFIAPANNFFKEFYREFEEIEEQHFYDVQTNNEFWVLDSVYDTLPERIFQADFRHCHPSASFFTGMFTIRWSGQILKRRLLQFLEKKISSSSKRSNSSISRDWKKR